MPLEPKLQKGWMSNIQSFFQHNTILTCLILFFAGGLNVYSYAPFSVWPVVILSISLLILTLQGQINAKQAARYGFSYGLGWFATGISWVHVAIAEFGGMPLPISLLLMVLLVAYLSLFPALASYLTVRFKKQFGFTFFLPAWLAAEWLRSWFLTGFPWLSIGYTQTDGPLAGYAPLVGEIGIQALLVAVSLLLIFAMKTAARTKQTWLRVSQPLAAIAIIFVLGESLQNTNWQSGETRTLKAALVQGNIEQSLKWQPDNEIPTMLKYLEMSEPHFANSDVIFWPEAAIPRLEVMANEFLREIDRLAAKSNTAVVTGIVDFQPESRWAFNNLIVLGAKYQDSKYGHYKYLHSNRFSKHHLLPIGEFIPFESFIRGIAPLFDLPMSSFNRGEFVQDNLIANSWYLAPAICFEIAFADQVRANVFNGKQASDIILTVSNDAWFGDSHGPWQHLQIAQMRAKEFAKPVVRVTNNGVTAIINANGEIAEILPQFEEASIFSEIEVKTSQTLYHQLGNLPVYGFLLIFILFKYMSRRKRG